MLPSSRSFSFAARFPTRESDFSDFDYERIAHIFGDVGNRGDVGDASGRRFGDVEQTLATASYEAAKCYHALNSPVVGTRTLKMSC